MDLLEKITDFQPYTEQESVSKDRLLSLIKQYQSQTLDRNCPEGHITCSGLILSPDLQKTLMAYHLIYQSIGWTGGHADGDADLLGVAIREAREETSIQEIYPLSGKILSIDILPVPAHEKHGRPVPAHLHYNITYGLIAPENQAIADKPDENRNVQWIPIGEISRLCTESHMIPIYEKIIARMKEIAAQKQAVLPEIVNPLSSWYQLHKRDLPWRKDKNPYHVWISEIMLQQTRVEAVKNYYTRFLNTLPDVQALAACPEETALKLWEGLGYYNRIRNMQKAARIIVTEHQGKFPADYDKIRNLPGIGDYTAGAICSICFGMPTPAVDGNVLRVMARIQENFRNILDLKLKSEFTAQLAKIYTPKNSNILTQSLMELGATICIPNGTPLCESCPLADLCMSHKHRSTSLLPVRIKKQKRRIEKKTVFILISQHPGQEHAEIAIRKRPDSGLLASLWELPNVENFLTPEEAVSQCSSWGVNPKELLKIIEKKHIFTHITWEMQGVFLFCEHAQQNHLTWADTDKLKTKYSLPTAFRIFLEENLSQ